MVIDFTDIPRRFYIITAVKTIKTTLNNAGKWLLYELALELQNTDHNTTVCIVLGYILSGVGCIRYNSCVDNR